MELFRSYGQLLFLFLDDSKSRVKSFSEEGLVEFDAKNVKSAEEPFWANYIKVTI